MMQNLERLKPLALLLLRCALGMILMFYGYPKLFTQRAAFVQSFSRLGLPSYSTYVFGVVELFGGGLLILGLLTRVAGILVVAETVFVLLKFHLMRNPRVVQTYQFELLLAVAAFTLVAVGAGVISLDHLFFRSRGGKAKSKD